MITRLRHVFTVRYAYVNPLDQQRAQILLWVSAVIAAVLVVWAPLGFVPQLQRGGALPNDFSAAVVALVACLVVFRLSQVGRLKTASWIFVVMLIVNATLLAVFSNYTGQVAIAGTSMIILTIPMVAAGVLLERRGMLVVGLILVAIITYGALGQSQIRGTVTLQPSSRALLDFFIVLLTLAVMFMFLAVVAGSFQTLSARSAEAIEQRRWISSLGTELVKATDESALQAEAIRHLRQHWPQLRCEWYVLRDDGVLTRSARAVEGGRYAIRLRDDNILAEAARSGQLTTASLSDTTVRRSHLAVSAAFAAAAPIKGGGSVIAVLDVQSSTPFSSDYLDVFRLVAEQIGMALHHLRQLRGLQATLQEQEATIIRQQSQIQANDERRRQGVSSMWNAYIEGRGKPIIGYSLDEAQAAPVPISELPPSLAASLDGGKVQIEQQGDEQIIHVPISFRDYNLGAMSFAVPAGQPLSDRQLEVARTVAERLALALENTRLFEQSQAQAQRERKANEVAGLLIGATDVRLLLNLAAENFKDALGAVNTHIYIQPDLLVDSPARAHTEVAR